MSDSCSAVCNVPPFTRGDLRFQSIFDAIEMVPPEVKLNSAILSKENKWRVVGDRLRIIDERKFSNNDSPRERSTIVFGNGRRDSEAVLLTMGRSHKDPPDIERLKKSRAPGTPNRDMRKTWTCRTTICNQRAETLARLPGLLAAVASATGAIDGNASSDTAMGQMSRNMAAVSRGNACAGPGGRQFYQEWVLAPGERAYDFVPQNIIGQMNDGFRFLLNLGWVNYWSDPVAAALNFPDPELDDPIKGLYERIEDKGWLVRLTGEPLNLDIPEHLERLSWAYSRFSV